MTDWTRHWEQTYGNFFWRTWVWRISRAYRILLKDINVHSPSILELGCGSGINSLLIAKILNSKKITLVDSNKAALRLSKKLFERSGLDVRYLEKDIFDLKLDEKFDIVHSEGLIEHFYSSDRMEVFKRHVDFCEQGGFIVIFVPYRSAQYALLKGLCKISKSWIYDEQPFRRQELHKMANQLNLKILREYTSVLVHEIGILARKCHHEPPRRHVKF